MSKYTYTWLYSSALSIHQKSLKSWCILLSTLHLGPSSNYSKSHVFLFWWVPSATLSFRLYLNYSWILNLQFWELKCLDLCPSKFLFGRVVFGFQILLLDTLFRIWKATLGRNLTFFRGWCRGIGRQGIWKKTRRRALFEILVRCRVGRLSWTREHQGLLRTRLLRQKCLSRS